MDVTYKFEGKVQLVTGGNSGMGFATAKAFARADAAATVTGLDQEPLDRAVEEIRSAGGKAIGIHCDVADEAQFADMVARAVAEFGRLDAAFNNAGIQVPASDTADQSAEEYDRFSAINQPAVWACMKHGPRQMREQGSGAIVNCPSTGGVVGRAGIAAYHGTKRGVIGLMRSVALEYADRDIRINAVCPGTIDTPMVSNMLDKGMLNMDDLLRDLPMKRLGTGDETARAVLWLCSSGSGFVTGHALLVDGGFTAQ
ncbi:3-oxoacyl-ACP reductase (plasmid) [Sinorhizobium meliloti]|uniref:glucose 1-dehydrogenase n=1 Tax=Rhizobium meliloti TaxID=382 RepID=UPI000B4A51AA|nr:glucose 1-dehydrogenase [Sinorhizobium meliloti]ASP74404.1 3-oxoacyl-ACP reductase [Sinorhizobium meliloti]MDE3857497.1 glucose 1-dehydrogenase [Sinorhizobium meliloti]MQW49619.1 glucose 1-dehydrogenase [Sinorhizobium meliloti]MQW49670.1 glucose 1-dehydrogenase [Sinorhizobium meliloti]RVI59680.1 glucose 1-dehydrogenase [Sinorhizobium meliloti]